METIGPRGGTRLNVTRDKAWYGRLRKLRVLLNGAEIGRLASGESKPFDITSGSHELYVQMDWVKSKPMIFTCEEGDQLVARCVSPGSSFSFRDIFFKSVCDRASRSFTVFVSRQGDDNMDEIESHESSA